MKALAAYSDGEAELRELEKPGSGTLVKTLRAGIDGTDHEVLENASGRIPDGDDHLVMAHEAVGKVVESDYLEEGQLVVPTVRRSICGCLHAENGRNDFCPPGHYVERGIEKAHGYCSEYFAEKNPDYLVPVPDDLEDIGVLVEPASVVRKAVDQLYEIQERLDFRPERALVLGAGSIGLLASMLFRKYGLEVQAVDVVDRGHPKTEIIESIGASYVDNRGTAIDELQEPDIVLEASGVSSQIFEALQLLESNGAMVSVGLPREKKTEEVPAGKIHETMVLENKLFLGSVNSAVHHFQEAVDDLLYFRENFPVEKMLDVRASLENWEKAFEPRIKGEIVFE